VEFVEFELTEAVVLETAAKYSVTLTVVFAGDSGKVRDRVVRLFKGTNGYIIMLPRRKN